MKASEKCIDEMKQEAGELRTRNEHELAMWARELETLKAQHEKLLRDAKLLGE